MIDSPEPMTKEEWLSRELAKAPEPSEEWRERLMRSWGLVAK